MLAASIRERLSFRKGVPFEGFRACEDLERHGLQRNNCPWSFTVESKKQGIGSSQAAQKELNYQRIARLVIIALRSGAVDHEADSQFVQSARAIAEFYV